MKNFISITGRLPKFEGKYTPASGDKKSRMNWSMNVQINSKNDKGYNDEALINFTAWGYYADKLQEINLLPWEDDARKATISLSGRLNAGYKDKEGNIINNASIEVSEFETIQRFTSSSNVNAMDAAPTPGPKLGVNPMGTTPRPTPTPGMAGRTVPPMPTPGLGRGPKF